NGGDNPGIDTPGCHRHADVAMLDWKCDPTIPVMVQADIDFMEYSQQSHINVSDGTTHAVDTAADRPYDSGSLQSTDDLVFTGFSDPDDAQDIPTETYDASLQSTDDLVFTGFSDPDNAQDVPTDTHYGNCISKLECKPSMITPNEHCNIMDFAGCLISSRTNNSYSSGISAMVTFDGSDPCSQPSTSMSEGALVNKEPSIYIEARSQESIDVATSPPLKSRLRDRMKQKPTGKMPVTRHPTLQPTRPVLFAAKRNTIRQKVKPTNRKSNKNKYTLQDLVDETLAQLNDTPSTPCIDMFLMDQNGYQFVQSTIRSHHESWLAVAGYVASLLRKKLIHGDMRKMALSLMSIEFWLNDIAKECRDGFLHKDTDILMSPFADHVLQEFSTRALSDEASVCSVLQRIWSHDIGNDVMSVLRYLLRNTKHHNDDPYAPGLRVLAVLTKSMTSVQLG
ncbi:uncharacterized protein EDB91DRAFT_1089160, partial [Suillus paluster]|uniref:uncharacterized protein n=1 Tax=Suillus paluster TaxID=48578 RepID=UPI001B880657